MDLGLERSGHVCVEQVEINSFCCKVLERRWPHVARWPDIRKWQSDGNESVDLLCGGFPCQEASIAGKRFGLDDDRTALFWEIIRIAKETKPTYGLFENVPGLFSVNGGKDFHTIVHALQTCWPVVGWRTLDSRFFNVAQTRERIFFICGPSEKSIPQILFEPESGSGNFKTGTKTGERVAKTLANGSSSSGFRFDPNGEEFIVAPLTQSPYADNEAQHRKLIVGTYTGTGARGATPEDAASNQLVFQPQASSTQSMNLSELAPTMGTTKELGVFMPNGVRRLTTIEAERLQGFPDGWSCLCQPLEAYREDPDEAHLRCTCPDSPRYRALGNAVTVNVITYLGSRLKHEEEQPS